MTARKSTGRSRGRSKSTPKKIVEKVSLEVKPSKIRELTKNKKATKLLVGTTAFLLLLLFLYLGRSLFVAAMVGGRPVSRLAVVKELEKQQGKNTLENLITKELILQEARKQNINISDEEVAGEIDKIKASVEAQGQTLDAALALQGQTIENLQENVRIQKTLEKMLENDVQVSEEEMSKYFAENKSIYGDAKYEDLKEDIKSQLKQEKLSTAFQTWIEKLRSDTRIIYFLNY